jgi:hypothetical protein
MSHDNLYNETIITRNVRLPYTAVGDALEKNLKTLVSHLMEGKCSKEGYIQIGTMQILTYSVGLQVANDIEFEVVIKCYVCCPIIGMRFPCVVKNNTGAGIRAEYTYDQELDQQIKLLISTEEGNDNDEKYIENKKKQIENRMGRKDKYNSPIVVYLASDQQGNKNLQDYSVNRAISIEVIGQRYELNEKHVNIIGILK